MKDARQKRVYNIVLHLHKILEDANNCMTESRLSGWWWRENRKEGEGVYKEEV